MITHPLSRRIADVLGLQPDAPALEYEGCWVSWGELGTIADRIGSLAGGDQQPQIGILLRNRPAQVAALLGHSSISITGDIYGHGSDDGARAAVLALGARLNL